MTQLNPFQRDARGLLQGVNYATAPNGAISWRAMIKPEFLYPNHDYREELEARFGKKLRQLTPEELVTLEDRQLLVRLEGWRDLLRLRGYKSLKYRIEHATAEAVSATCEIEFLGNFETDGVSIIHSASAGASIYSVSSKMHLYLEAMAVNRAFSLCMRAFLGIEILGKDEFDPEVSAAYLKQLKDEGTSPIAAKTEAKTEPAGSQATKPYEVLALRCQQLGFTLEQIKTSAQKVRAEMVANPESAKLTRINGDPALWATFENIDPLDCFTLLDKINSAAEKKTKKK